MASAAFKVNGSVPTGAVAVTAGSTVTLALVSTTGLSANAIAWSIVGNHAPGITNPTITASGTPTGATATFTMPAGSAQAYLVQCVVNGGIDASGNTVAAYTARAIIGVIGASSYVPFCSGETTERSSTHGWAPELNNRLDVVAAATGYVAPTGAVANRLTYSTAGNINAWSTSVWSDGTYIGFGATTGDIPTTGSVRLAWAATGTVLKPSGYSTWLSFSGSSGSEMVIFGASSFPHCYVRGGSDVIFKVDVTNIAEVNANGLTVTGEVLASTWVGVGSAAALPTTGSYRLASTGFIAGYCVDHATGSELLTWTDVTRVLQLGEATYVSELNHIATTEQNFDIGATGILKLESTGATVTGALTVGDGTHTQSVVTKMHTDAARDYGKVCLSGGTATPDNSARIHLYGPNDSTYPDGMRLQHGGTGYGYIMYYQGDLFPYIATNLGAAAHPWGDAYVHAVILTSHTVANAPAAASYTGGVIYVSNGDAGNPCLAVSNGTNWLRIALGTAISAT